MTRAPDPTPSDCAAALAFLQRQLDGDAPDLPPAVEDHLGDCTVCRERYQVTPDLLAALARLDAPEPSALFTEQVIGMVQSAGHSQRRQRGRLAGALAAAMLLLVWMNRAQPPGPAPGPEAPAVVQSEPPALRRSVAEAGDAVVALTQRAAREAVGDGQLAMPNVPVSGQPWQALEPAAAPLADARQGLAEGFEPVVSSARRAVQLFLRDVPLEAKD